MNPQLVFAKTPLGEEAVRQSTQLVQRNLRMVLVQVDGQLDVTELSEKIGNPKLVEDALMELEEGGYIVATIEAASFKQPVKPVSSSSVAPGSGFSSLSEFSTFDASGMTVTGEVASGFSSFADSVLPETGEKAPAPEPELVKRETKTAPVSQGRGFPWRKAAVVVLLLIVLLPLIVLVYPYARFRPAMETLASEWLGVEVGVERVAMAFLPTPVLTLKGVRLGAAATIDEVRIASPQSLFGAANAPRVVIPALDVSGVRIQADQLISLPRLTDAVPAGARLHLGKIRISELRIAFGDQLVSPVLSGELAFSNDGNFKGASLATAGQNLKIKAEPVERGWGFSIEGRDWRPDGMPVSFGLFEAKGMLQNGHLSLQNVDTSFLGGLLKGNWSLAWQQNLSMAGEGELIRLDGKKLSAEFIPLLKIEGELSAKGRFKAKGSNWQELWGGLEGAGTVELTQGLVYGLDPMEASRRNGMDIHGGSTRFQHLQMDASFVPKRIQLRNLRLESGPLKANGTLSINDGVAVDGVLDVVTQTSVASQHVAVKVYGTLPALTAQSGK